MVETFGTGIVDDSVIEQAVEHVFDLRPAAIIEQLDLRKPIYKQLAAYGHMGREELGVKWENRDKAEALQGIHQQVKRKGAEYQTLRLFRIEKSKEEEKS